MTNKWSLSENGFMGRHDPCTTDSMRLFVRLVIAGQVGMVDKVSAV